MSFGKILLLAASMAANISFAEQEQVFYTCEIKDAPIAALSIGFERDSEWDANAQQAFRSKQMIRPFNFGS